MGILPNIFLTFLVIFFIGFIFFLFKKSVKTASFMIIGLIISYLLLTEELIIPFFPKIYCGQWYHRNIVVCPNSIILDYGAPAADGYQTCYTRWGRKTGFIGGWGDSGGTCMEEGCRNAPNICK